MNRHTPKSALAQHRRRLRRQGIARIELQAPAADAALLRDIAKALRDAPGEPELRARLAAAVQRPRLGLKAFLESAPLEGLDLTRVRYYGRDIEL